MPKTIYDGDRLLSKGQCAKRHHHSVVSEWRWEKNPKLNYPPPDAVIAGREYRYESTMERWERSTCKLAPYKPDHLDKYRQRKEEAKADA